MAIIEILLCMLLAIMIVAASCAGWWLHHKIGIYKEQQKKWAIIPSFESLEFSLKAIRKFTETHYPEGNPRLDMAAYSLLQYIRQMRYLARLDAEKEARATANEYENKLNK